MVKVAWPERDFTFLREDGKPVSEFDSTVTRHGCGQSVGLIATFIVDTTTTSPHHCHYHHSLHSLPTRRHLGLRHPESALLRAPLI